MKRETRLIAALALVPAALFVFVSCSSAPSGESETTVAAQPGVPGGIIVDTYRSTATVTGIDPVKRKVTLVTPDGKKTEYKAGPEVVNFDQIRVGDQVKATVTDQLVVFMASEAPLEAEGTASVVALAPVGAKPGGLVADTVQVKARVVALDYKKRKATLKFPDGSTRIFPVRKDVDLSRRTVGEEVMIRCTEAIAITVEKP